MNGNVRHGWRPRSKMNVLWAEINHILVCCSDPTSLIGTKIDITKQLDFFKVGASVNGYYSELMYIA